MDYESHHDRLTLTLIGGQGAPTIAMVDEDYITEFVADSEGFVNLLDLGAGQYQDDYLPWKWQEAATADGSVVIGLGADVGGLALCYRKDLFEAAGLPSDRDDVSAALGDSWEDFIDFGESYRAATGKWFIDNATNIMNPAVWQLGTGHAYYDRNDQLDMRNIKPAFDTALDVIEASLSANIGRWSPEWEAGLTSDEFAVVLCSSSMLGYIEQQISADEFEGQWDVADIPGPGGNWGGSFYTIPNQGSEYEQQEAYHFLEWLLQPEQQVTIMEETGRLPSRIRILKSDAVDGLTNPFFNDAPYGEIFAQAALDLPAGTYCAPNSDRIRTAIESVLDHVQAGTGSWPDAWDGAVGAAEAADA